jgi:hypothetical protein
MARKSKGSKQVAETLVEETQSAATPEPAAAVVVVEPSTPVNRRGNSTVKFPVAVTWVISHNMCVAARTAGEPTPARKALVNAAIEAGVGFYTARTQVQAYLKASKGGTEAPAQMPRNVSLQ